MTTLQKTAIAVVLLASAACVGVLRFRSGAKPPVPTVKPVDFVTQVQPLIEERCYKCHNEKRAEGKLRLDDRAAALAGGESGKAIIPGHSAASLLVQRVLGEGDGPRMPKKAEPLSDVQVALLRAWIDQGAKWSAEEQAQVQKRKRWAFQPLEVVAPPTVSQPAWCLTPIDRFVMAKLDEKKIAPSPATDKRRLIRRAYFDLLGLPPKPEEVEAFVNDAAPDAWEKLIDRLLASPHYGERWARHWLDASRFAESHGFEQDYDRPYAFWFRDFAIKALNDDMPYDQFVKWQLAGDELAPDNPWALAATGFLGAGQFPTQLTEAEFEPARYDELDNMAATTGTAMLGLTIGCARCHDHKFDPIPTKEYYRFAASFTTTIRSEIDQEFDHDKFAKAKEQFDAAHTPLIAAREKFEKEVLPTRIAAWAPTRSKDDAPAHGWVVLDPSEFKSKGGATLTRQDDGSFLASGTNPASDVYTFVAQTSLTGITGLRIEALAHPSFVKGGPGRADNGNFDFTDLQVTAGPADGKTAPVAVKLINPKSTFDQGPGLAVVLVIDGSKTTGWAIDPQFGKDHAASFEFEKPVGFPGGTTLTVTMEFNGNTRHNIGRPRVAVTSEPPPLSVGGESKQQGLTEIFSKLGSSNDLTALTDAQRAALIKWFRTRDADWQKLDAAVQEHLKQEPKPDIKKMMVTSEGFKPIPHHADGRGFPHFYPKTYVLNRGDTHQKGDEATQGFLQVLNRAPEGEKHWQESPPKDSRTSYRRRSLANWITDTKYGAGELLARVIVNRVWHHHFGRGIVATPNDFGMQGERPTHPELLDWLANDLITHGWQLKRLHKLIMTSAVYQQSSTVPKPVEPIAAVAPPKPATALQKLKAFFGGNAPDTPAPQPPANPSAADPQNRLLWHWPEHRLEAEAIRDSIMFVSGQLDETPFGPGSLDPNQKRRSIYFFIKRSELIPVLMLFDFPEPNTSVGRRVSTTIAPQALLFLNNQQVRNYARAFAARVKPSADPVAEAYRQALQRAPTKTESDNAAAFLQKQTELYRADTKPNPADLSLTDLCQVLFGLNEFIYME